jgi:Fe2+ transport system protein FeoA
VVVLRRGLWGGPVQVRVRDFALSLHRAQAAAVRVQALAGQEAQRG